MKITENLYKTSLALLTDFYQLTMAYGYWNSGKAEQEAVFNLFFRKHPFNSGFTIAAGLEYLIDFIEHFSFQEDDIDYLKSLKNSDGTAIFPSDFLEYLKNIQFTCDIEAVEEGTVIFPNTPIVKVRGPLIQCQLMETALLNLVNFQSLIATKAARIVNAAKGDPVLEFGLRRAQGIDGALAASRASYIGGCSATSNVLAGKLFGIPVSGTHAHSWIMSFSTEKEAFEAYADSFPDKCVFLVDTYDTEKGIQNAIEVGKSLRNKGKKMVGIRIDSGDLAYFSNLARKMLDDEGFFDAKVVASNDLDEHIITSLKIQEATIDMWGVGTKLVTAYDQPALGAVYKLAALKNEKGEWEPKIKVSQQTIKINVPGDQKVIRFLKHNKAVADMICLVQKDLTDKSYLIIDPMDATKRKKIAGEPSDMIELLQPIFIKGKKVYDSPSIHEIRERTKHNLQQMDKSHKRLVNPHVYPVGLEESLYNLRTDLVLKAKSTNGIEKL
jgi:nicotinate phosphoribosyltransferase